MICSVVGNGLSSYGFIPPPTNTPIFVTNEVTEIENYKSIIESHIQQDHNLQNLVTNSNENLLVTAAASSILIKELVAKLIELKGTSPSSTDQKRFARAIILVIPAWRYPGSEDGTDILFDQVGRGGLIQARLRHIHKALFKNQPKTKKRKELVIEQLRARPVRAWPEARQSIETRCADFKKSGKTEPTGSL
ncbi:hypothetical protein Fcan01_00236 [Folsomia candida]|uniref:Uncharacterized protein n=1 Tax=Folsomia candida TaxID=158441 RepID=A0A226EW99_FOLCA|nr:hypothetical protein Fcan01_00236 [Folsomia candida]